MCLWYEHHPFSIYYNQLLLDNMRLEFQWYDSNCQTCMHHGRLGDVRQQKDARRLRIPPTETNLPVSSTATGGCLTAPRNGSYMAMAYLKDRSKPSIYLLQDSTLPEAFRNHENATMCTDDEMYCSHHARQVQGPEDSKTTHLTMTSTEGRSTSV